MIQLSGRVKKPSTLCLFIPSFLIRIGTTADARLFKLLPIECPEYFGDDLQQFLWRIRMAVAEQRLADVSSVLDLAQMQLANYFDQRRQVCAVP